MFLTIYILKRNNLRRFLILFMMQLYNSRNLEGVFLIKDSNSNTNLLKNYNVLIIKLNNFRNIIL